MAVYMIFKYGKQFRFALSFNNFLHVSHVASSFSSSEANKPMMTKLSIAVAIQTAIEGIVCTENIVHEHRKRFVNVLFKRSVLNKTHIGLLHWSLLAHLYTSLHHVL